MTFQFQWHVGQALLVALSLFLSQSLLAEDESKRHVPDPKIAGANRVEMKVEVVPTHAKPGETVRLKLTVTPKGKNYTYPITARTVDQDRKSLSFLTFTKNDKNFAPLWDDVKESKPKLEFVEAFGFSILKHPKELTWEQDVLVLPTATTGTHALSFKFTYDLCDDQGCIFDLVDTFNVPITVEAGGVRAPAALSADVKKRRESKLRIELVQGEKKDTGNAFAPGVGGGDQSLLAFILQGIFWGAVSLVTPCVFPMIPITVSFFLKKSEEKKHKALTMAVVYSATIVIVLTIAAVALLKFFQNLSVSPTMNFFLGALFIFFALSLFGMYDIKLPSGLSRFTSSREGQGVAGTIFMALTFTIISFACVAPFLGGFTGTADTKGMPWYHLILGGLAFSATFAAPFFVLALFPTLLKKLPQSGGWMNTVKVVMGFVELAAALKFFRAAELAAAVDVTYFTYDLVLGLYVGICLLCGLYLLALFRLPHDSPTESISASRMLLGLCFVCLGLYLTPALFKNGEGKRPRPAGVVFAWLDAFLLPDEESDLPWHRTLDQGIEAAKKPPGKRIFIDFTGKLCTNCKYNEHNVFTQQEVKELMLEYVLVQLYTDVVPKHLYTVKERTSGLTLGKQEQEAKKNQVLREEISSTAQLPLYAIVEPEGINGYKTISVYPEGKINDVKGFTRWLVDNIEAPKEQQVTSR